MSQKEFSPQVDAHQRSITPYNRLTSVLTLSISIKMLHGR